jgi:hypothetical protein
MSSSVRAGALSDPGTPGTVYKGQPRRSAWTSHKSADTLRNAYRVQRTRGVNARTRKALACAVWLLPPTAKHTRRELSPRHQMHRFE